MVEQTAEKSGDMLEAVARAMVKAKYASANVDSRAWDVMTEAERRSWLHLARAAVEAYEGSQQLGLLERADGWWR